MTTKNNLGTHLNKIIIATGVYLNDNRSCSTTDIQNMIIRHFDDIRLPLKDVQDGLEVLVLGRFLDKVGEDYRKVSVIYTPLKVRKEQEDIPHLGQSLWNMDVL